MVGAGALAAATIFDLPAGVSPAHAQGAPVTQAPGFYRYKVGDITVTAINDGFAMRPVEGFIRNADIADVKKALESAFLPTTSFQNTFTTLVVQTGGKLVLLDTGLGDNGPPTTGTWMSNFKAAGFDPANVDQIVISHFHGDHIGGIRLKSGSSPFTKAEISVPAPEWDFWMSDERMNAAPEMAKPNFMNVRRVFGPVVQQVKRFAPGAEVAPGITSVAAHGHSPGHTTFVIASGTARMMFVADITSHPALFVRNPDWSAVFDQDPDMARATRRRILDMVASDKLQVAFYHAPFPATGYVSKSGTGFEFVPVQWSAAV
ncbi:MAG: MBL fold metallo-hydrolase [Beijerinckiaceae bacterium]|nr:MBL fold metallo-hydrolase [Beijerinckiaceae bacterium]